MIDIHHTKILFSILFWTLLEDNISIHFFWPQKIQLVKKCSNWIPTNKKVVFCNLDWFFCADMMRKDMYFYVGIMSYSKYWNCRRILNLCFLSNFQLKKISFKRSTNHSYWMWRLFTSLYILIIIFQSC